jgi:16S rRNA (uracil1498-N3)-methyltransferase
MHRHLVTPEALLAETCALGKEEARHLQTVLRIKLDDEVELFDGQGRTRQARVKELGRHSLTFFTVQPVIDHPRPPCALTLFACVSKGKHMDWTIEKAVELGVARIVPVISARTIVRIEPEDCDAKKDRWMRIAEEAARQCGSAWLPEILPPCSLVESLPLIQATTPTFVAALTPDAKPLRECLLPTTNCNCQLPTDQAGFYVGPEGDFTPEELAQLQAAGAIPVSLGKNVLRTETACLYGLCALNCAWL